MDEKIGAERPFVEDEFDVEGGREQGFDLVDLGLRKIFGEKARRMDGGRAGETWIIGTCWPLKFVKSVYLRTFGAANDTRR